MQKQKWATIKVSSRLPNLVEQRDVVVDISQSQVYARRRDQGIEADGPLQGHPFPSATREQRQSGQEHGQDSQVDIAYVAMDVQGKYQSRRLRRRERSLFGRERHPGHAVGTDDRREAGINPTQGPTAKRITDDQVGSGENQAPAAIRPR